MQIWNGTILESTQRATTQKHPTLLTNKGVHTRGAYPDGMGYSQIGNSRTWRPKLVSASFKRNKRTVGRNCGLRRCTACRRLDSRYFCLPVPCPRYFFSTLSFLLVLLHSSFHFRSYHWWLQIRGDGRIGALHVCFVGWKRLWKVNYFGSKLVSSPRELAMDCDGKGFDEEEVETCKVEENGAFGGEDGEVILKDFESVWWNEGDERGGRKLKLRKSSWVRFIQGL